MPFSFRFVPKSVQSAIAHRTPENEPHARTSRTLFRMDFARTRTRATAHRTCACAHAPSQLRPCFCYVNFKSCLLGAFSFCDLVVFVAFN